MFFTIVTSALASDYKYKILDPRYNPQAQQLLDGKLDNVVETVKVPPKKFDFGVFLAIFALVMFPVGVFSVATKYFKLVSKSIATKEDFELGNIKIVPHDFVEKAKNYQKKLFEKEHSRNEKFDCESKNIDDSVISQVENYSVSQPEIEQNKSKNSNEKNDISNKNFVTNTINKQQTPTVVSTNQSLPENTNKSINTYFSSPVEKLPNPMLLTTSPLTSNKGLCVVEYNKKYSLIGYINDEIFLLDQFETLKSTEIRSRLTETDANTDRYIVRLGDYKAIVEVQEKDMKLLLEL